MTAKEGFAIHLRPADIEVALGPMLRGAEGLSVESALQQLCEWGNIERHPDTTDVSTVEEFYRPRFLYQLTPEGEAAEHAIAQYADELRRPGELQTAALTDIRALLDELAELCGVEPLDEARAHRTLTQLRARFDELTTRAQAFMGSLPRGIDLHGAHIAAFLTYKETLINYLERFIGELLLATADIATLIHRVEDHGVDRLLRAVARRDLADAIATTEFDVLAAEQRWAHRWSGLRSWFLGAEGTLSQAEVLRARARSAIPSLLSAISSINDRRVTRSDRAADLRTLARWFAELDREADLHRLWRAAFALAPARHLRIDESTLDARAAGAPISAQTSWLDAPPLLISPRLRALGHQAHHGRPHNIIDRSRGKTLLLAEAELEAAQLASAQRRLANGRRTRLSELGELSEAEFDLFLDLLGEAIVAKVTPDDVVDIASSDGAFRILLEPTRDGTTASIPTSIGQLSGPDHWITIDDVFGATGEIESEQAVAAG